MVAYSGHAGYCRSHGHSAHTAIEPSDGIVDANNGVFIIESGITVVGDADGVRPGLCAPIEVVAAVLFGDPKIGRIFGLPAVRPYLSDI